MKLFIFNHEEIRYSRFILTTKIGKHSLYNYSDGLSVKYFTSFPVLKRFIDLLK